MEHSTVGAPRAVYWVVRGLLEKDGKPVEVASRVGLRCARLVWLELVVGLDRGEAASAVGVTARQARFDRELLGRVRAPLLDGLPEGDLLPAIPRDTGVS